MLQRRMSLRLDEGAFLRDDLKCVTPDCLRRGLNLPLCYREEKLEIELKEAKGELEDLQNRMQKRVQVKIYCFQHT